MTSGFLARLACSLALLGSFAGTALAQAYQPYPAPKITAEQFAAYAKEVREFHGASAEIYKDKQIVVFADPGTRTFWVFTLKEHPAHPAWITRQMVDEEGQVHVRQIGFFAGSEPEFARLFREYQQRNEQLRQGVEKRNQ